MWEREFVVSQVAKAELGSRRGHPRHKNKSLARVGHSDVVGSERFVVGGGEGHVGGCAAPADAQILYVVEGEGTV